MAELAGLMVHWTLPTAAGPMGSIGVGQEYDRAKVRGMILEKHANTFITRLSTKPNRLAKQNNAVQEVAETSPWGIPVTISSDPWNPLEVSSVLVRRRLTSHTDQTQWAWQQ